MDQLKPSKVFRPSAEPPGPEPADGTWTISSRPNSVEGYDNEYALASIACSSIQYGGQVLHLSIKPSTAWTAEDLQQLSTLVQSRNRFVCMQLVTMVKEQYDKVAAARSTCDAASLHTARHMFLGTVALQSTNGDVVAAGLFYPRRCSKDGVELPHMYVELLCCNSPGKGYGSVLLHHIEQYTFAGCEYISADFFGTSCSTDGQPNIESNGVDAACSTSSTSSSCQVSSTSVPGSTSTAPQLGLSATILPVLQNSSFPAEPLSSCCTGCSGFSLGSSQCDIEHSTMMEACPAALTSSTASNATAIGDDKASLSPTVLQEVLSHSGAVGLGPAAVSSKKTCCAATKRMQGIKLLSVGSAQAFYMRNGYGAPDVCKEMFKPFPARDGTGSASTSSICSMMSTNS